MGAALAETFKQFPFPGITAAAGDTLIQLAPRGDTRTISVMFDILDGSGCSAVELKVTALKVLSKVAIPGDMVCLEKISNHLKDVVPTVREETLTALGQIAPVAHEST